MSRHYQNNQNNHAGSQGGSGHAKACCTPEERIANYDIAIAEKIGDLQALQARKEDIEKENSRIDRLERAIKFAGIGIIAFDAMLFLTGHWVWLGIMMLGGNFPVGAGIYAISESLQKGKEKQDTSWYDLRINATANTIASLRREKKMFEDMLKYRSQAATAERHSSMGLNDCYTILECRPNASDAEVHAAYRKFANEYHPDRLASCDLGPHLRHDAEEKFKKINEAYETIRKSRS